MGRRKSSSKSTGTGTGKRTSGGGLLGAFGGTPPGRVAMTSADDQDVSRALFNFNPQARTPRNSRARTASEVLRARTASEVSSPSSPPPVLQLPQIGNRRKPQAGLRRAGSAGSEALLEQQQERVREDELRVRALASLCVSDAGEMRTRALATLNQDLEQLHQARSGLRGLELSSNDATSTSLSSACSSFAQADEALVADEGVEPSASRSKSNGLKNLTMRSRTYTCTNSIDYGESDEEDLKDHDIDEALALERESHDHENHLILNQHTNTNSLSLTSSSWCDSPVAGTTSMTRAYTAATDASTAASASVVISSSIESNPTCSSDSARTSQAKKPGWLKSLFSRKTSEPGRAAHKGKATPTEECDSDCGDELHDRDTHAHALVLPSPRIERHGSNRINAYAA